MKKVITKNAGVESAYSDEMEPAILVNIKEFSKENFPMLNIDFQSFVQSIEKKINDGYQYHCLDLICDYINELIQHSTTLWFVFYFIEVLILTK
mgnify:CR=1 FL=1